LTTPLNTVPPGDTTIAPTAAQFLADFPEFDTSGVTDPDAVEFGLSGINYWLNFAVQTLNACMWGTWYYTACELFVAHNLSLEAWSTQGGNQTIPGIAKGPIAATSSGDVSVSYNNVAVLELDAGHWGYTIYGGRLLRMIRLIGAGPRQVTGGYYGGALNGPAWSGPPFFNFPNPSQ
jgi:hypothetical protein